MIAFSGKLAFLAGDTRELETGETDGRAGDEEPGSTLGSVDACLKEIGKDTIEGWEDLMTSSSDEGSDPDVGDGGL